MVHGTSLGKSYLFLELMDTLFKGKKVLYVIPKHSTSQGGIESYDEYKNTDIDITFKTYNHFKDEERAVMAAVQYDLIVFDEAHHLGSNLYGFNARRSIDLMRKGNKYVLGMTATNMRDETSFHGSSLSHYGYIICYMIRKKQKKISLMVKKKKKW